MMNIYFVCTGNTCRSPMAAAILKNKNIPNVEVKSAGVYAMDGGAISNNAATVLKQKNINYTHQSSQVTADQVAWADLILTMTMTHREALINAFPHAADRIFTLKEYVGVQDSLNVSDPYGGNVAIYEQTFEQLTQLINELVMRIQED